MATRAAVQALGGGLEPQGGMMFSKEVTLAEGGLGYRLGGGGHANNRTSENTQLT